MNWRDKLKWGIEKVLNDGILEEARYNVEVPTDYKIIITRNNKICSNSEYLYSLSGHWIDAIRKEVLFVINSRINNLFINNNL